MVGVSKSFQNNKQVLKNIYLSFFYGAKIGIIGLNGSGKSTLLKIIAGLEKSYQGEVVFSPGYSAYSSFSPRSTRLSLLTNRWLTRQSAASQRRFPTG